MQKIVEYLRGGERMMRIWTIGEKTFRNLVSLSSCGSPESTTLPVDDGDLSKASGKDSEDSDMTAADST